MKYIKLPYIPENMVTHVLLDKRVYDRFLYALEDLGIKIVICESCDDL